MGNVPSNGSFVSDEHAAFERLTHFHHARLDVIETASPASDDAPSVLVVHLLPQLSFGRAQFTGSVLREHGTPIGAAWCESSAQYSRFNADGWFMPEGREKPRSYSQLFRDGRLEAVLHGTCYTQYQTKVVHAAKCEAAIFRIVPPYLDLCEAIGLQCPIWLFSSLVGFDGARFKTNAEWNEVGSYGIESATVRLPELVIGSFGADNSELLRRWCDGLWQAGGNERSPNYEKDGTRRQRSLL